MTASNDDNYYNMKYIVSVHRLGQLVVQLDTFFPSIYYYLMTF